MLCLIGGSGYLGTRIREFLDENEMEYVYSDRRSLFDSNNVIIAGSLYSELSIKGSAGFSAFQKVTKVIFLSAQNDASLAELNSYDSLNSSLIPLSQIRDFLGCMDMSVQLIFLSSASVYDSSIIGKVDEEMSVSPSNSYELHKILCEHYVMENDHQFYPVVLRLSNLYGLSSCEERSGSRGIFNSFIRKAAQGGDVEIFAPATWRRDFIFLDDAVDAILAVVNNPGVSGIFNLASGSGVSFQSGVKTAVDVAKSLFDVNPRLTLIHPQHELSASDVRDQYFDITAIKSAFGWEPATTLQSGITRSLLSLDKE
jgi:UDP-glucose 4-epimerase